MNMVKQSMMNSIKAVCAVVLMMQMIACSESDKEVEELPLLVERHQFFYIQDATLFDFDPETGNSSIVRAIENEQDGDSPEVAIASDNNMMLGLDTDLATLSQSSGNQGKAVEQTTIDEYIAYVKNHELHVYDLSTRYNHNLGPLPEDAFFCDVREVLIVDKNTRDEEDEINIFKNERSIYVKAASNRECTSDLAYYRAYIIEDDNEDQFYTRRNLELLEHTHVSTHEHDHEEDGHSHSHLYEDGHIDEDGNIFDSTNHAHNHTHEHEPQYGYEEAHNFLTKEEIDAVHNDPEIQEFNANEHRLLKVAYRSSEEALMYSTSPIIYRDNSRTRFGHLGYESTSNCLKFFEYDTSSAAAEDPIRHNTWSIDIDSPSNFDTQNCGDQDREHIVTHLPNLETNDSYLFTINNRMHLLPIASIFEDDDQAIRADRIRTPIVESSDMDAYYSRYDNTVAIRAELSVYTLSNPSENTTPLLLRSYSSEDVESIEIQYPYQDIFVYKNNANRSSSCSDAANTNCFSMVSLDKITGLETTVVQQDSFQYKGTTVDNYPAVLWHYAVPESNEVRSEQITADGQSDGNGYFSNAMWGTSTDLREVLSTNQYIPLSVESDTVVTHDETDSLLLEQPSAYILKEERQLVGTIPNNVYDPISAVIMNNYYGFITIKDNPSNLDATKTYFFPTGKSYINPTGDFGDMKLMYQSVPEIVEE